MGLVVLWLHQPSLSSWALMSFFPPQGLCPCCALCPQCPFSHSAWQTPLRLSSLCLNMTSLGRPPPTTLSKDEPPPLLPNTPYISFRALTVSSSFVFTHGATGLCLPCHQTVSAPRAVGFPVCYSACLHLARAKHTVGTPELPVVREGRRGWRPRRSCRHLASRWPPRTELHRRSRPGPLTGSQRLKSKRRVWEPACPPH